MLAKSFAIALAATVALGLSAATFTPSALAADSMTKSTDSGSMMKSSSKSCAKLDKASQAYKDCKAKAAAAKKSDKMKSTDKMKM
jgi:hypothetical protein